MSKFQMLCLIAGVVGLFGLEVQAQEGRALPGDENEDEDDPGLLSGVEKSTGSNERVVEVARGGYMQIDPVVFDYLGQMEISDLYPAFGLGLLTGHGMRIHAGGDIVTTNRIGLSAQATFWQVFNKSATSSPDDYLHQGATMSHFFEASIRPTLILGRSGRVNLYLRGGGGVCILWQSKEAQSDWDVPGIYSSFTYGLNPRAFVGGGGGFEYYTRLSHFSFTFVEVDFLYIMNLDMALAINFAGFKYTF